MHFDLPTELEIAMYKNYLEFKKLVKGEQAAVGSLPTSFSMDTMKQLHHYVGSNQQNHKNLI